jgi:hypothetical protein
MTKQTLQEQQFMVLRPIRYKKPGPDYRKLILPGDKRLVDFPHLPDEDIQLLVKLRIIAPATEKDVKDIEAAEKARERVAEKAAADAAKAEGAARAAAKKQALQKHLEGKE